MFRKLSFKIGLLFLSFFIVIVTCLFLFLYKTLANDRIDEVMNSLLARGNTHRDVLEDHFDSSTLQHVGIMESTSEFIVIITDERGDIIISSDPVEADMMDVVNHIDDDEVPTEGKIVEDRWNEGKYIATDSPITVNNKHRGHVFMFAHTNYVKRPVEQLSKQFFIASLITVCFTIIAIFILSRFMTRPLLKMKEATEQLSRGKHNVTLHTERKDELGELAHSITKLSKDLKEMKLARNEFLANISHELRTPLTYINGYAAIVNRPDTSVEEMKEYAQIIGEETEHLTGLINNLFELAKINHHTFAITEECVDLYQFLQQIAERFRPALAEKQMTLQIHCPKEITAVIDPKRFTQIFMNLLDNAKKHSSARSNISITVEQTNEAIVMTTMDEGEGIPKDDLPYIFDRLYRVEKSRSRQTGGAGLGLAITKQMIESHSGIIEVQSKVNVGTTVIITLPRRDMNE